MNPKKAHFYPIVYQGTTIQSPVTVDHDFVSHIRQYHLDPHDWKVQAIRSLGPMEGRFCRLPNKISHDTQVAFFLGKGCVFSLLDATFSGISFWGIVGVQFVVEQMDLHIFSFGSFSTNVIQLVLWVMSHGRYAIVTGKHRIFSV